MCTDTAEVTRNGLLNTAHYSSMERRGQVPWMKWEQCRFKSWHDHFLL